MMGGPVWGGRQAAGKADSQAFSGKRLPHRWLGSWRTKPAPEIYLSLYRSILRLAVFGKFGDATRPDDHTSPRAHARSSAAASPHPDAVLTRLAAQRSNVLELHSALTTADGHTARRSKLVEHGGARSWE